MESKKEDLILIEDLCAIINDSCDAGRFGDNGEADSIRDKLYKTMKGHEHFQKSGEDWHINYAYKQTKEFTP